MKLWKKPLAALLAVLMTGCAGSTAYQTAKDAESVGQWDRAVANYAKALELNPENPGYKAALARAKLKASQVHFEKGKMYRASGRPELAVVELAQTVLLDPTNDYAEVELRKAEVDYAKHQAEREADTKMETLKKKTRGVRAVLPMLEPSSDRPINLNFPQPKPIKQIYRALGRRRRDQRRLRSAAQGRQRLDRPGADRVPEGARDSAPAGEPLLQDHRRAHDPHRRRYAPEPKDLRGSRHQDVLPVERRRDRGRERAARPLADDAHFRQQGRELDHAPRYGRQGRRRRAHRRAERQAGRRGRDRRRAAADQRDQGAEPRHPARPPGRRRLDPVARDRRDESRRDDRERSSRGISSSRSTSTPSASRSRRSF